MPEKTRTDPDRNFVLSQQSLSIPEADPFSQPDPLHGRNPPFRGALSPRSPPLRTSPVSYHKKALRRPVLASSRPSFRTLFFASRRNKFQLSQGMVQLHFSPARSRKTLFPTCYYQTRLLR